MAFVMLRHCRCWNAWRDLPDNNEIHNETQMYRTFEEEKEEDNSICVTGEWALSKTGQRQGRCCCCSG